MAEPVRCIRVVSAVVERRGCYLITQSSGPGIMAGLWEFPTTQVLTGESDEAALRREIRERIGVEISVGRLKARRTHFYVGYSLERVLYDAQILPDQQPRPLRVADLRWVAAQDLESYPFSPADQATMDSILGSVQGDGNRADGTARARAYA
ncbi:MAG: NUDIX domain-containing protein [Polyangia bacterium]